MLSDATRMITKLLIESRTREAIQEAESARASISDQIRKLEVELDFVNELIALIPSSEPSAKVSNQPELQQGVEISKVEQRQQVLTAASEVGTEHPQSHVTTSRVETHMQSKGQQPPTRTAIGLILNHDDGWERIDVGLYKRRDRQGSTNEAVTKRSLDSREIVGEEGAMRAM